MRRREHSFHLASWFNNRFHLNSRGLHLNDKGATRLAQDFKKFLSDIELG